MISIASIPLFTLMTKTGAFYALELPLGKIKTLFCYAREYVGLRW